MGKVHALTMCIPLPYVNWQETTTKTFLWYLKSLLHPYWFQLESKHHASTCCGNLIFSKSDKFLYIAYSCIETRKFLATFSQREFSIRFTTCVSILGKRNYKLTHQDHPLPTCLPSWAQRRITIAQKSYIPQRCVITVHAYRCKTSRAKIGAIHEDEVAHQKWKIGINIH